MKNPSKTGVILYALIGLALFVRLIFITQGYPFIFHPDEPTIVRSALGVRFNPNPEHFDWPHLYIYLNFFVYSGFALVRKWLELLNLKAQLATFLPVIWDDTLVFYYITRSFTAILGALTLIPVYLTGAKLFNTKVGLLSAAFFAIIPFHLWHSHYSLPDVPMVFFLTWAVYFSAQVMLVPSYRNYLLTGLFVGFAASTKYNGGLVAVCVLLATVVAFKSRKDSVGRDVFSRYLASLQKVVISGFFAVVGFIIGTPFAVLDIETFTRTDGPKGALWQFTNVGSTTFGTHLLQLWNTLTVTLPDDLGYTLLFWLGFALVYLLYKVVKKEVGLSQAYLAFLLIPALVFIYYISGFSKPRSHYFMISYPFLALISGYFVESLYTWFNKKFAVMAYIFLVLVFVPPTYASFIRLYTIYRGDTRVALYAWAKTIIPKNAHVFYSSSSLEMLPSKLPVTSSKGLLKLSNYTSGYVFLASDNSLDSEIQQLRQQNKSIPTFTEVYSISRELKTGPNIKVYYYNL